MTFLQMVFEFNIWSGLAGQGHFAIGGGATGGDATSGSSAFGALGGDVSDNTSIGNLTINS